MLTSNPPTVHIYRLDPAAFDAAIKPRVYRDALLFAAVIVLFAACELAFLSSSNPRLRESLPSIAPLAVVILVVLLLVRVQKQLRIERSNFSSYELALSENVLLRSMANAPAIELLRSEVTLIAAREGRGLTVRGANRSMFAFVPEQLVGFAEVKEHLAAWRPLEPEPLRNRVTSIVNGVVFTASLVATWLIADVWLAMLPAVIVAAMSFITLRELAKSRVVAPRAKLRFYVMLVTMMLTPFARIALFQLER